MLVWEVAAEETAELMAELMAEAEHGCVQWQNASTKTNIFSPTAELLKD